MLSLFFIDEVAKYRDYDQLTRRANTPGYSRRSTQLLKDEYLGELALENDAYRAVPASAMRPPRRTTATSPSTRRSGWLIPAVKARGEDAGQSDDVDAYDLILKDKERLLFTGRTGALHLLALGPARRLGQSERVRHVHAQAQRQHHLPPPGSRTRPAALRRPDTASGWTIRPPCTTSTY